MNHLHFSSDIQLLDAVQVGRIIFGNENKSTDVALYKRVLRLKDSEGLPIKKLNNRYRISYGALKQWMIQKNL